MKNGKRSVFFLVYYRPLMQHFFKAFHMAGFLRMVIRYGYNFMRYQWYAMRLFLHTKASARAQHNTFVALYKKFDNSVCMKILKAFHTTALAG